MARSGTDLKMAKLLSFKLKLRENARIADTPGFTPREVEEVDLQTTNQGDNIVRENEVEMIVFDDIDSGVSGHFKKTESPCLTHKAKNDWVKELCGSNKVNFLTLQETKMESIELFDIKRCWGNFAFDYVHSDSVGNSGGILCVWDPNSFVKLSATVSDYFVILRGNWVSNGKLLLIISMYAPQELAEKKLVWDYLGHVMANWKGEVIIMGDFNEVCNKNERFGSNFNVQGANAFNSFIANAGLEEVHLGGCSFTCCHTSGSKMIKLDRFLISESLLSSCPNISAITFDRYLSDHRPILLRESTHDYGPIPFCFFHYWCELKYLKKKIRACNDTRQSFKNRKYRLTTELADLEEIIDKGGASNDIINKRTEVVKSIQETDKLQAMEMAQKAKIK
ncbi:RNA-directed DNA polymerase, eukaryota [Tanacetum coccineum]